MSYYTIYNFNHRVIHINLEGITHEESLKSPVEGGNSINWVVGHLILSRDDIFEQLGLEKSCDEKLFKPYQRGTKDFAAPDAINLNELVNMFDVSQKKLEAKLQQESLTEEKKRKDLMFLAFHEAYHCGQTGMLRHVAGKEGAIK